MSKIFDGLMGFIVGDAMGVPTEFCAREKLFKNPVTEMIGFGSHPVPLGSWSDDTSMTLALIGSINNKKKIDYDDIMKNFTDWVKEAKYTPIDRVFDIGRTCLRAIHNYQNMEPTKCGLTDINSNGNGSLMRVLPLVYYIYYKNITDEKEIIKLVNNISSLTHGHEISLMGCYIYVKYVLYLLDGYDKFDAYKKIKEIDYSFYSEETISKYSRIIKEDISKYDIDDISSSGYIVDTLEASLWMLLNTDNYKQAIIGAINLGNDTDTIAAICGSMAGIIYSYYDIPQKWLDGLLKKDYIYELLNKFESILCDSKKDILVGTMVGDIAGSRFELNNCKEKTFDLMPRRKCRVTDDTIMTLAVAKALVEANGNYDNLSEIAINNMVEIGRKYQQCGFGRTFFDWIKGDEHKPYNSYGNGAAMRISPCGVVAKNKKELQDISCKVTSVSHNHPDGIKGAEAVAMMIYLIRKGKTKEELREYFEENYYKINFTLEELTKTYKFKISCEETVPQAFVAFYESVNFEDAIRSAISIGGDSDTIAAICGSMAAIYYGIPNYIFDEALQFLDAYQLELYNEINNYLIKM